MNQQQEINIPLQDFGTLTSSTCDDFNHPSVHRNSKTISGAISSKTIAGSASRIQTQERSFVLEDASLSKTPKRCRLCGTFYNDYENLAGTQPCRYHPGMFRSPRPGWPSRWTCCHSGDASDRGCKAGRHVEDRDTTKRLQIYENLIKAMLPFPSLSQSELTSHSSSNNSLQSSSHSISNVDSGKDDVLIDLSGLDPSIRTRIQRHNTQLSTVNEFSLSSTAESPYLIHFVQFTDTLPGIAFKYGVTIREIKEANKMTHDMIYGYTQLLIPRKPHHKNLSSIPSLEPQNEEALKKQLVTRFRRAHLVSEEEARYYLELAEWNYDAAVNERSQDLEFERNATFRPAKRLS